eukprot:10661-Eustigmatos_ZCMA.PRE.1
MLDVSLQLMLSRYAANASMGDAAFQDSDGDLLIVPQEGYVRSHTPRFEDVVRMVDDCDRLFWQEFAN